MLARAQEFESKAPDFRAIPHDDCIPTFRLATWRGILSGTLGVASTNRRALLRVRAKLDPGRLREAARRLIARHPVLTSRVATRAGSPLLMLGSCNPEEPAWFDLQGIGAQQRPEEAQRLASQFTWLPFDLQSGPLFRVLLIRLEPDDHVFGFAIHHLVSDAVSCSLLLEQLWSEYHASTSRDTGESTARMLRYEHYLLATGEWMRGAAGQSALRRYTQQVTAGSGVAPAAGVEGARVEAAISCDATSSKCLADLAARRQSTLFLLLVAAVAVALQSHDDRVTIGGVVDGREDPRFRAAVGYFSDRVYWSIDVSGNPTFTELLHRVRQATAAVLPYRYVRSDHLLEHLAAERRPLAAPVLNFRVRPRGAGARTARVERFEVPPPAFRSNPGPAIPYWISLVDSGQGISGTVNGVADCAPRFVARLGAVLRRVADSDTVRLSSLVPS